ncbi:hypothetical protein [Dinghuibacter silviterrae]|uniref:TerB family tellurite resistance protein n=1 Tax=Dinghuibacter silviterrae TaxID=1539049 RepID=A0A4R8DIV2_9BACT|nr:hypothetical protein [Dinghuibacter silviterrae]TDW97106.1 hypothetical protein EDB95_4947 [Dinghuibacter silviterrae]
MKRTSSFYRRLTVLLLVTGLLLSGGSLRAQSWQTVMLEQIAKFQLYLHDVEKGYSIVQKGLQTIGDLKKGDLDLHQLFFSSLMDVSPGVKAYGKAADMVAMQVQIGQLYSQYSKQAVLPGLNATEWAYLVKVFSQQVELSGKDIDELTQIMQDGALQMDDAQRIGQIDKLYDEMTKHYQFVRSFSDHVQQLSLQRQFDLQGLQNLAKQY